MSSTSLSMSSPGGAAAASCFPLHRYAAATPALHTKPLFPISKKFLVSSSSSSNPATNDTISITSQLPLGRCCYSTASAGILMTGGGMRRRRSIPCEVAAPRSTCSATSSLSSSAATVTEGENSEEEEERRAQEKIGAKVRVKVPLKVHHVPRVPELDLTGKEGTLKQYVGLWKGKRISASYPFKIEFVVDIEDRGPVKFFSHLREDEFEYLD